MEHSMRCRPEPPSERPLCVDLDGTLVKTDLLVESFFALLRQDFWAVWLIPLWLLAGKARLKQELARRVALDPALLPYNQALLAYLRAEKSRGRVLVLATAADRKPAQAIAAHLGLFERVIASDGVINLSGPRKLGRFVGEYGEGGFDYAANARVDVAIWGHAHEAILVNPERGVQNAVRRVARVGRYIEEGRAGLRGYLQAARIHQWLKNLLIFLPLILAHRLTDPQLLLQAGLAFAAFGACASSVYLLNDLLDLPADRRHPLKRHRPFAAGSISVLHGTLAIPILLMVAVGIALWLPAAFLLALGGYYLLTLAYSLALKRIALIDVLTLAGLYTVRIVAGAAAVCVTTSFWLLAFSVFLFYSLAMVKRFSELHLLQAEGRASADGRDYGVEDLAALKIMGVASGYLAVLVMAFYINSEEVQVLYSRPEAIWLLCPLLLYWISRVWLLGGRGQMPDDPVVFAVEDNTSRGIALLSGLILYLAI